MNRAGALGWVVASLVPAGCACPPPPLDLESDGESGATTTVQGPTSSQTTLLTATNGATTVDTLDSTTAGTAGTAGTASEETSGVGCDESEILCDGACVDPRFDPDHCGASDPCDANPGVTCEGPFEGCAEGGCTSCDQLEDFEVPLLPPCILGTWALEPDWCIYSGAPSSTHPAMPFASNVLGTDGNRSAPYPGTDDETSSARSGVVTIGHTLAFRSWHVDEGGMVAMPGGESFDNKIIELELDMGPVTVVDCGAGIGLQVFCLPSSGPRASDDWDAVVIDTSAYAGMRGTLRFAYETNGSSGSFEQGWFIDDLRTGACGVPTSL